MDHYQGRTEIYRLYDAEDRLLYVGISFSAHFRLMQHVSKRWWADVVRKDVRSHRTRVAALRAEARAIRTERPIYNVKGRPPLTDDEWAYRLRRGRAALDRARADYDAVLRRAGAAGHVTS